MITEAITVSRQLSHYKSHDCLFNNKQFMLKYVFVWNCIISGPKSNSNGLSMKSTHTPHIRITLRCYMDSIIFSSTCQNSQILSKSSQRRLHITVTLLDKLSRLSKTFQSTCYANESLALLCTHANRLWYKDISKQLCHWFSRSEISP